MVALFVVQTPLLICTQYGVVVAGETSNVAASPDRSMLLVSPLAP